MAPEERRALDALARDLGVALEERAAVPDTAPESHPISA